MEAVAEDEVVTEMDMVVQREIVVKAKAAEDIRNSSRSRWS